MLNLYSHYELYQNILNIKINYLPIYNKYSKICIVVKHIFKQIFIFNILEIEFWAIENFFYYLL